MRGDALQIGENEDFRDPGRVLRHEARLLEGRARQRAELVDRDRDLRLACRRLRVAPAACILLPARSEANNRLRLLVPIFVTAGITPPPPPARARDIRRRTGTRKSRRRGRLPPP